MKQRCYNKNNPGYKDYGGRGIKVCDRWVHNFKQFKQDMGDRPTTKHSIERMNNDGDYEPSNCKWATQTEQNLNQRVRSDNKIGVRGVIFNKTNKNFRAYAFINGKQINLGSHPKLEQAVSARENWMKENY